MSRFKDSYDALDSLVYCVMGGEGKKEAEKLIEQDLDKLGKLEDLEEELGCPIDVAIKKIKELEEQYKMYALNFVLEYDRKKKEWYIACYACEDDFDGYSKSIDFKLKDYGKTWWLQEEKHIAKKPKLIDGKLYCSVCNKEIRHNHNYCLDCGHKIEGR